MKNSLSNVVAARSEGTVLSIAGWDWIVAGAQVGA